MKLPICESYKHLHESDAEADFKIAQKNADANLYQTQKQSEAELFKQQKDAEADIFIQLTSKKKSSKMLMNHQKKDEHNDGEEHVYVLPRQKVAEFIKVLKEDVKANPDFKTVTLAIDTRFLKK